MNKTCASCGASNDAELRFCQKCGKPFGGGDAQDEERLDRTSINEKKWRAVNEWGTLIAGAQGKEDMLAKDIKKNLEEIAAPDISIEHREVKIGGLVGWFSASRRQLVIENKRFVGHHVFVSVSDYGKQLNVCWYLMVRMNFGMRFIQACAKHGLLALLFAWWLVPLLKMYYAARSITIPELMNTFDREELTAFGTTVHHAVTKAVQSLMGSMDVDFSRVDTKSRGFLNIS